MLSQAWDNFTGWFADKLPWYPQLCCTNVLAIAELCLHSEGSFWVIFCFRYFFPLYAYYPFHRVH